MNNEVINEQIDSNLENNPRSNIDLIYTYTENHLNNLCKSLDNINTKLVNLLAVGGVLIRLVVDLPANQESFTKSVSTILLTMIIALCLSALSPSSDGQIVSPEELRYDKDNNWYYAEEEQLKRYILDQWIRAEKELKNKYNKKAQTLKTIYCSLATTGILFGINVLISIWS